MKLNFSSPLIMAILNYTSDSFYDGGRYNTPEKFFDRLKQCIQDGADIIDIGVASTRPGAKLIDAKNEWEILKPILIEVKKQFPEIIVSIDTYNSYTAEKCIEQNVDIINDVSGGTFDNKMFDVIAKSNVYYVLMHTSDIPERMQQNTNYQNVVLDVKNFLQKRIDELHSKGFENIIVDPGFGFGKTVSQNFELLKNLDAFKSLQKPILVGLSRKSMIYKTLNTTSDDINTLIGTTNLNAIALMKGANILRVHDVTEHKNLLLLMKNLL
jgi:dihydropteroate synthase